MAPAEMCNFPGGYDVWRDSPWMWYTSSAEHCDHCFCKPFEDDPEHPVVTKPHRLCCKCDTRMAEEFVSVGSAKQG